MNSPEATTSNKLSAVNGVEGVLGRPGGRPGQKFSDRSARGERADRRGGPAGELNAAIGQAAGRFMSPSAACPQYQALSRIDAGQVAREPSHGLAGMADFRRFGVACALIDSFRTGPAGAIEVVALVRQLDRTEGGAFPLSAARRPPMRVAQVRPALRKNPAPMPRGALFEPMLPCGWRAKSGTVPVGSGVGMRPMRGRSAAGGGRLAKRTAARGVGVQNVHRSPGGEWSATLGRGAA